MRSGEDWAAAACLGDTLHVWLHSAGDMTALEGQGALSDRLASHLRDDAVLPVLCAQGMVQAGTVKVPAPPPRIAVPVAAPDPRMALWALPDMVQDRPADRMGAPLVQVTGFIATYPDWDGVLCLTGPRSKWVHISAGEVVSFRSFMTGELFALLAQHSSLKDALAGADWDQPAFEEALAESMSRPERLGATLATAALQAHPVAILSGALIGAEIAAARPYWLGQNVALIGGGGQMARYRSALAVQGVQAQGHATAEMALRGLQAAHRESMA